MGEVVNLRRFRKTKDRQAAGEKAEANRIAFGRTRIERETTAKLREHEARQLDGHRLSPDASGNDKPDTPDA
jgi:hypothetical protein